VVPASSRAVPLLLTLGLALAACTSDGGEARDERDGRPAAGRGTPTPSTTTIPPGGIEPAYFGMHDSDPVGDSWPDAPVGAIRVWDSGTVWNQVETSPGTYDWSRLDAIVETARARGAEVLIVLGQTPAFHSRRPEAPGAYGPGAPAMPDLDAWTAYLRAAMTRYTGEDIAFQVWNEANVAGYWAGTPAQMARLTAVARQVADEQPTPPVLVAPAMATRLLGHRAFFRDFYRQRVDGRPVADFVDVLSFQLYPEAGKPVERSMELLDATRALLRIEGVDPAKPIWNTEINYGLQGGLPATPATEERQVANVVTTYVLNAAYDVERVYWYSWDLQGIADTALVGADNTTKTAAGAAVSVVREWLVGTVPQGCADTREGVWVCRFAAADGTRTVYWNPAGRTVVRTPFASGVTQTVDGGRQPLPLGGTRLEIGPVPVLVGPPAASLPGPVG
jgi:hypothetical protein